MSPVLEMMLFLLLLTKILTDEINDPRIIHTNKVVLFRQGHLLKKIILTRGMLIWKN